MLGLAGFMYFFEWTSSLIDIGYAKHEDPMGRILVKDHDVNKLSY
jgi:hypothetical protein